MSDFGSIGIVPVDSTDGRKVLGYVVLVDGEQIGPVYYSLADAVTALINIAIELGLTDRDLRKINKYVNDIVNEKERKNERVHQSSIEPT
ncbi:hypothetical protein [Aeromonas dhakensis]|uniref:hypothetical protein n=1 Tax=Aeromonas dhakensis TaxID=196024 RepID=UPI0038D23137